MLHRFGWDLLWEALQNLELILEYLIKSDKRNAYGANIGPVKKGTNYLGR